MDKVLLVDPIDPSGVEMLRRKTEVIECREASFDGIRRAAADADAIITRSRLPDDLFLFGKKVRAVTIHGTGLDLVPLKEASERAIPVANIPGGNAQSVAEYCVMAMLVLARNLPEITAATRNRPWDEARLLGAKAGELRDKCVGLVGVGGIGKRLARICRHGFEMAVLGHQRRLNEVGKDAEPSGLDELLAQSDFVVLSCPLTPETHHLMNRERLSRMKPTAWLINVGRGAVVDEAALIEALRERRIAGAMLDVYEHYRLEPGHPLFLLPNVVLTPHLAGMTQDSRRRMGVAAAGETLRMLDGRKPLSFVNPEVWSTFIERRSKDH